MAFQPKRLAAMSNPAVQGIPTIWGYKSTENTFVQIAATGFFNEVRTQLKVGDIIVCQDNTDGLSQQAQVNDITNGVVDLTNFSVIGVATDAG